MFHIVGKSVDMDVRMIISCRGGEDLRSAAENRSAHSCEFVV